MCRQGPRNQRLYIRAPYAVLQPTTALQYIIGSCRRMYRREGFLWLRPITHTHTYTHIGGLPKALLCKEEEHEPQSSSAANRDVATSLVTLRGRVELELELGGKDPSSTINHPERRERYPLSSCSAINHSERRER